MTKLLLCLLFTLNLYSQNPGTITVSTKVTADTNSFFCYFFPADISKPEDITIVCNQKASQGGKTLFSTLVHLFDSQQAFQFQTNHKQDSITLMLFYPAIPSPFKIAWTCSANGTIKNGGF